MHEFIITGKVLKLVHIVVCVRVCQSAHVLKVTVVLIIEDES